MIAGASFEQALSWDVLQSPLPIASPRFGADETTMLRWGTPNPSGALSDPVAGDIATPRPRDVSHYDDGASQGRRAAMIRRCP